MPAVVTMLGAERPSVPGICIEGAEWNYSLVEGAKGVQLAELGMQSWKERKWVDVPELT